MGEVAYGLWFARVDFGRLVEFGDRLADKQVLSGQFDKRNVGSLLPVSFVAMAPSSISSSRPTSISLNVDGVMVIRRG
ncbi:MAG: hypothetical protein ACFCUR_05655 [Rhodomicrobiaceae bacterium]